MQSPECGSAMMKAYGVVRTATSFLPTVTVPESFAAETRAAVRTAWAAESVRHGVEYATQCRS